MKRLQILCLLTICMVSAVQAQRNHSRLKLKTPVAKAQTEEGNKAVVIDRRLAVLRTSPSLYSRPIQRMSVGREVRVLEKKDGDGVEFYRVRALPNTQGWVQSEAVIGNFRKDDDQRLAKLIQASGGFEQIDKIAIFLEQFPTSRLRPNILLLLGDLMEQEALKLSQKAAKNLDRREMAASGAPLHSFYLNFPALDRYGKIGINFLFNLNTKQFHYNGDSWFEIIRKYPNTSEAEEAAKRLEILTQKMDAKQ